MNLKSVERIVAAIQAQLFKNANSLSTGMLKSNFRGGGLQFREHQIYSPGDDVRFIDWNLSARTQHTYVKTFEEERNVEIVIILDIIPSMFYGSNGKSKLEVCLEIASLVYLLAGETNDKVRVVVFGEQIHELSAMKGRQGLVMFISLLEEINLLDKDGKLNFSFFNNNKILEEEIKLKKIKQFAARKKEVVILSDYSWQLKYSEFKKIATSKHMHHVQVLSPIDSDNKVTGVVLSSLRISRAFEETDYDFDKRHMIQLLTSERYLEKFIKEMR